MMINFITQSSAVFGAAGLFISSKVVCLKAHENYRQFMEMLYLLPIIAALYMKHNTISALLLAAFLIVAAVACTGHHPLKPTATINDFNSNVYFATTYKKNQDGAGTWGQPNPIRNRLFHYTKNPNVLSFVRPNGSQVFHVATLPEDKMSSFAQSYGPFQFLNVFKEDSAPADLYYFFYVNPATNDVLQIVQSGNDQNIGFLFTQDSVNYLKDEKLF
jgi:hypothetical protein